MTLRRLAASLGVYLGLLAASSAHANPASVVPSGADPGNTVDLHFRLDYGYELDRSTLVREDAGDATDPLDPLPRHKDLAFRQFRHVLTPRAELAIYHDTWVYAALPLIITQARELELADGVAPESSTTLQDGFLPTEGFDARDPGTAPSGGLVFRGIGRKGIDQVHLGLGLGLMNQARDRTKPTWKLGGEVRLAVGKVMEFDALAPGANTAVGRGVHEVRVWTSVARRNGRIEGWFDVFWQIPFLVKKESLFQNGGFGSTNARPGQKAGSHAGLEIYALDDKTNGNTISLDLGGGVVGHFEGREYTEMWEVFALAGDSRVPGPLVLDSDPTDGEPTPFSHPGITNVENHLETSAHAAIRAKLGDYVRFAAGVDLVWKTDHLITFADAGLDLPQCGPGVGACEDDDNDVVNPETREVNPLHAPLIDLVGHRYFSEDNLGFVFKVMGQVLF
ncbi:MAG TPA: hypothetical protein VIU61_02975 [Kofleriaceae bacterium]